MSDVYQAGFQQAFGVAPPPTAPSAPPATPQPQPPAPAPVQSGAAHDEWWSHPFNNAVRVLDAAGYAAAQEWGASPSVLDPAAEATLRRFGVLPDYQKGDASFVKAANEALIRPAAAAIDIVTKGPQAILAGLQAGGEKAEQLAQEPTPTFLGEAPAPTGGAAEIAGFPGRAVAGAAQAMRQGAFVELYPGMEAPGAAAAETATRARAVGALGEGEAGYYDAVPLAPEAAAARARAASETGIEPPPPDPPPPDVHALARRIDPETFQEFDALQAQATQHRIELGRLAQAREASPEAVAAQADADTILGRVHGVEARLTNAAAGRLADARDRLDAALTAETPEMAATRAALMDVDYRMRDLAPDVSEAYRQAREMAPALPETAPVAPPERPGAPEERPAAPRPAEAEKAAAEPPAAAEGTVPAEEAQARVVAAAGASPEAHAEVAPANVAGAERLGEAATGTAALPRASRYGGLRAIEGTGETTERGLAAGIEESAIEEGLTTGFSDLPEYERVSMADQATRTTELMNRDYEWAKDVAMGRREPPRGLLPESVLVGVEKRAMAEGDVETLRALATRSKLTTAATTMGQRIRTLGERDRTSPVGAIQEVQRAREAALGRDVETAKAETAAEIKAEVQRGAQSAKPDAWADFVAGLQCSD